MYVLCQLCSRANFECGIVAVFEMYFIFHFLYDK